MDAYEVLLVIQGYQNRFDDFQEAMSRYVATLVNPHVKRKVTADKLFKRQRRTMQQEEELTLAQKIERDREQIHSLTSTAPPLPSKSRRHR